jgi:hypothetical protein
VAGPRIWARHIRFGLPQQERDTIVASDRPFRRQLMKLFARALLGRRRAHYYSWLPSLRIMDRRDGAPGTVFYRGEKVLDLSDIGALAHRARRRILIVGSGPSVKELSVPAVPPRQALLLNGAISLIDEGLAEPLAVAIEDERFVWRHFGMIARHVPSDVPLLLSVGAIRAICDLDRTFLKGRSVVLIDDLRKPYGHPRREDPDLSAFGFAVRRGAAGFSSEPDRGVFQGGSVVVSALQFALATMAREIGFIGIDITNANSPRFYEEQGTSAFSGVAGAEARILEHIALANDIADYRGVRLVNHSPVSALRSIGLDYFPVDTSER